ncbi:MAG TPA: TrbI F-type domain-containing protein [Candidatus Babeliales bacterium]|nr:TrbI F-type domain-containing protein [Candidatus Babeliales bacterium]
MLKNFISKEIILQALSQLLFGMLGALLVLSFTHRVMPTIATVNITGLEDSFIQETSKQTLSETEKKKKVEIFAKTLNQTVIQLAKEKHLVFMPSQAVISDTPDFTQEIARKIKMELNQ